MVMPERLTSRFFRAALVGAMSGLLIMGALGIARAEDDDGEMADQKFLRNFLTGLGLQRPGQVGEDIEFRERSPLVVPPTRDLPPPETTSATQANPAWPVDQDLRRRQEAKHERRRTGTAASTWEEMSRQLPPGELNRGAAAPDKSGEQGTVKNDEAYSNPLKPSELGYKGGMFSFGSLFGSSKEETAKFDKEPPRASLTDPPVGYRTPSPSQPYGVDKTAQPAKPMDKYDIVNQGVGSTTGGARQ